uniref:NADH-ubiquinone oxidoreductase chain 4L n=1 Tax=Chorotypus fenestratus TaxID=1564101 RepID=A0A0N7AS34_9ORTH|nr:NADH dehydrogenase subunit 4L [Chorotypus fenestratus]
MLILSSLLAMLMYLVGVYLFSSLRKHLLIVLLSLEYIVISLFLFMITYLTMFSSSFHYVVIYLVLSVCEGSLGLSILISMIRSHGSDFFNLFNLFLC